MGLEDPMEAKTPLPRTPLDDAAVWVQHARDVAIRKTRGQFPFPHHEHEKRVFFAREAAREFCDRVLPGGYASLTSYPADTEVKS